MDIDRPTILDHFSYDAFLPVLRRAFGGETTAPPRAHHEADGTTLLLMPAWNERRLGVKTVTVAPANRDRGLPSVQATYDLFDRATGTPLARLDGRTVTNLRTAAASAIACDLLAPSDARRLLVIGHGTLAPELIRAHSAVRPIREVRVHGRSEEAARSWLATQRFDVLDISASTDLATDVAEFADIVSCATTSSRPVFPGAACRDGQHVDLVGSYQPHTREADDDLMVRAHVLLDTEMAALESGDVATPLETGVLTDDRMLGTLASVLAAGRRPNVPAGAITVFKSVGVALEDLTLAEFLYDRVASERKPS